jgi:hypothetical protein
MIWLEILGDRLAEVLECDYVRAISPIQIVHPSVAFNEATVKYPARRQVASIRLDDALHNPVDSGDSLAPERLNMEWISVQFPASVVTAAPIAR